MDTKIEKEEEAKRLMELGGLCGYEYIVENGKTYLRKSPSVFPKLYEKKDEEKEQEKPKEKEEEQPKKEEQEQEQPKEKEKEKDGKQWEKTSPFAFEYLTQEHYRALGKGVTNEIYRRMKEVYGLEEVVLHGIDEAVEGVPVFMTPGLIESEKPLVVIICGTGEVTAGMWARSLCINNTLEEGSALPDIAEAQKNGFNVLVMNPNVKPPHLIEEEKKAAAEKGECRYGVYSSEKHTLAVWKHFVIPCHAKKIALFVHSYGGINALELLKETNKYPEVMSRIATMAMTDTVHYQKLDDYPYAKAFVEDTTRVRDWIGCEKPLDDPCGIGASNINMVSSGHDVHEWTTCSARSSVWPFIIANMARELPSYKDIEDGKVKKDVEDGEVKKDIERTEEKKE